MLPGLHANASSSVTPLPDNAYEIAKMLLNHSKRITQGFPFNPQSGVLPLDMKLPKELESDQYTFAELPPLLQRQSHSETWCDLMMCMTDEACNKSYKVRFQIMDSMSVPEIERSANQHVILDIRDRTARLAVIVPYEKDSTILRNLLYHDIDQNLKQHVFESTIHCNEIDGTKFFTLADKLRPIAASNLYSL